MTAETAGSAFFDLRATQDAHRWRLPVAAPIAAGPAERPFLFGGVGIAAAVQAMERTCGRPVIWATAQYLSFAPLGSAVDLDVQLAVQGRWMSQARVIGHVEDEEIITVNAALGERPGGFAGQWVTPPSVPPPEQCEAVTSARHWPGGVKSRFESRAARGRYQGTGADGLGEGRLSLWLRPKEDHPIGSDILAIMGDYISTALTDALGVAAGGASLDNTIRFGRIVPTDWVLADITVESVQSGMAHGTMRLFSRDGTLMASASQSMIVRLWEQRR